MAERDTVDAPPETMEVLHLIRDKATPIETLLKQIQTERQVPRWKAARYIYALEQLGEVSLSDPDPPASLHRYATSWYSAWLWAVYGFLLLVFTAIYLAPQHAPWIYARYVFGAVYVLYVPGAVFIEALYPQREELEDLERFALGVGLSLALVPLVGLALNYTPWGIRLTPIFIGITQLTLLLSVIALYRKYTYHTLKTEMLNP